MNDAQLNARFDKLERELSAVRGVADAILSAAGNAPPEKAFKRAVDHVLDERRASFLTKTQKFALFAFAGIAAFDTVLRILGVGG